MHAVRIRRPALEVRNITKSYSSAVKIGPISFEVGEGEFFSLLGPSGCGKTTTLRCIAGFEALSSGEIVLAGKRLDTIPPYRRELGLVFQSHALFPHLTIEDNVGFGLKLRRVGAQEIRMRVSSVLDLVGLTGLEKRLPGQISGGQQQRVALARSLVLEPPLLLLDEPLSSLDLKLRQQMREELRRLQRQLGQTTVFVTHDQTEALSLSDRIAVLSGGRIEQIGTPEEIYRRPASRFVASFIGQANLIDVEVDNATSELVELRTSSGALLRASAHSASCWSKGMAALAVIRPEDIELMAGQAQELSNIFSGRILDVEYLGEDTQVTIAPGGLPDLLASFKTTRAVKAKLSQSDVRLTIDPSDVVVIPR